MPIELNGIRPRLEQADTRTSMQVASSLPEEKPVLDTYVRADPPAPDLTRPTLPKQIVSLAQSSKDIESALKGVNSEWEAYQNSGFLTLLWHKLTGNYRERKAQYDGRRTEYEKQLSNALQREGDAAFWNSPAGRLQAASNAQNRPREPQRNDPLRAFKANQTKSSPTSRS